MTHLSFTTEADKEVNGILNFVLALGSNSCFSFLTHLLYTKFEPLFFYDISLLQV